MIHFHNEWHLGDCALQLYYQRALAKQGIESTLHCRPDHHAELFSHIKGYETYIQLKNMIDIPQNSIHCWIGTENIYFQDPTSWDYNNFYLSFFDFLSNKIGIKNPIESMICDYEEILNHIPNDSWDILYINSVGYSNGIPYVVNVYEDLCKILSQHFKVLTTQKIPGFECTRDYNWNLVQIGAAATKCKYIIGNNTSPIHLAINQWSFDKLEKVFIIDKRNTFTYDDRFELIDSYEKFNDIINYFSGRLMNDKHKTLRGNW